MIHTQELGFVIQILAQHCSEAVGYKFLHNIWPLIIVQDTDIFLQDIHIFFCNCRPPWVHSPTKSRKDAKSREEENAAKV
jgi:hypothetical protein